jgi:hypothetical protein
MCLGRRERTGQSLQSSSQRRETLNTCVVQTRCVWTCLEKSSQNTLSETDDARTNTAEKKQKSALRGGLSLDNGGPHKCSARSMP